MFTALLDLFRALPAHLPAILYALAPPLFAGVVSGCQLASVMRGRRPELAGRTALLALLVLGGYACVHELRPFLQLFAVLEALVLTLALLQIGRGQTSAVARDDAPGGGATVAPPRKQHACCGGHGGGHGEDHVVAHACGGACACRTVA